MQQGSSEGGRDSTSAGAYLHCAAILVVSHHHPAGVAGEALRRSRGNVAHLFELGLAESLRIRQHGGVDVNHDLVALARRPGVELMVQGGLGEQGQGIGLLLHPGRSIDGLASWAWPRSLIEGLAGGIERSGEQSTRFRSQATTDYHRAVVVPIDLEHAALVLVSGLTDLGIPVHLTPSPYDVLHVHCTPAPPHREQARLGLRGGNTVSARTLEYDSCPRANASANPGSVFKALATRTCSRAAPGDMPTRQASHSAQERNPVFHPRRASNSRIRPSSRAVAASRWADSSAISSPRRSRSRTRGGEGTRVGRVVVGSAEAGEGFIDIASLLPR